MRPLVPIVVATKAVTRPGQLPFWPDEVAKPTLTNGTGLAKAMALEASRFPAREEIDASRWLASSYRPTPTIIEAAQALYGNHRVEEITRSGADERNLTQTTQLSFPHHRRSEERTSQDNLLSDGRSRGRQNPRRPEPGRSCQPGWRARRIPVRERSACGSAARGIGAGRVAALEVLRAKGEDGRMPAQGEVAHPEHPSFSRCKLDRQGRAFRTHCGF